MRDEIKLTDSHIENLFGELGMGSAIDDIVFTRDTIDNFEKHRFDYWFWKLPGNFIPPCTTGDGHNCLIVENCQFVEGLSYYDICVIDFGTVRGIVFIKNR